MKNLYILGVKYLDLFKLLHSINKVEPTWNIGGFVDIRKRFEGKAPFNYPFYEGTRTIRELAKDENNFFFCNRSRSLKAWNMLNSQNCKMATLIHPSVDMEFVEIGKGCSIAQGGLFGGFIKIGNFVTFRTHCQVSHDTVIEDFVFVGPSTSIGSNVLLKKRCFIGQGAIVMGGVVVGENSMVGAGAVVTKDVPPNTTVIGIPARPMERKK